MICFLKMKTILIVFLCLVSIYAKLDDNPREFFYGILKETGEELLMTPDPFYDDFISATKEGIDLQLNIKNPNMKIFELYLLETKEDLIVMNDMVMSELDFFTADQKELIEFGAELCFTKLQYASKYIEGKIDLEKN